MDIIINPSGKVECPKEGHGISEDYCDECPYCVGFCGNKEEWAIHCSFVVTDVRLQGVKIMIQKMICADCGSIERVKGKGKTYVRYTWCTHCHAPTRYDPLKSPDGQRTYQRMRNGL